MGLIKKLKIKTMSPQAFKEHSIKQGVQIGTGGWIPRSINFGSEPYLVKLGNDVILAHNVSFYTHEPATLLFHTDNRPRIDLFGPIVIGNNVLIGEGTKILKNVVIGDNVVVGAGSIVTKSLASNGIYGGIPAKLISSIDQFYQKYQDQFVDVSKMDQKEKRAFLLDKFKDIL